MKYPDEGLNKILELHEKNVEYFNSIPKPQQWAFGISFWGLVIFAIILLIKNNAF